MGIPLHRGLAQRGDADSTPIRDSHEAQCPPEMPAELRRWERSGGDPWHLQWSMGIFLHGTPHRANLLPLLSLPSSDRGSSFDIRHLIALWSVTRFASCQARA